MLVDKRIYLASQSPRRRELLKQIGVAYDVLALRAVPGRMDVVEIPNPGEGALDFVQRMASEKAACGWRAVDGRHLLRFPVLGADTVVELEDLLDMIDKNPEDYTPEAVSAAKKEAERRGGVDKLYEIVDARFQQIAEQEEQSRVEQDAVEAEAADEDAHAL